MATDLQSLLMNLNGLDDARVERLGRAEFRRLYVPNGGRGTLRACDGSEVVFFEDRFDHAFFTTTDRYRRPYAKNIVSRDRIARVAWIGPVLRGEAANTQCWELIVVRDSAVKEQLQATLPPKGNPAVKAIVQAPVVIAVCG